MPGLFELVSLACHVGVAAFLRHSEAFFVGAMVETPYARVSCWLSYRPPNVPLLRVLVPLFGGI